jgi:hypothetical protein
MKAFGMVGSCRKKEKSRNQQNETWERGEERRGVERRGEARCYR